MRPDALAGYARKPHTRRRSVATPTKRRAGVRDSLHEALNWDAFAVWLTMLLHSHGLDVLRVKGLLDVGEAGPVVLDGVQHIVHRPHHLAAWPDDDHRSRSSSSHVASIVLPSSPRLRRSPSRAHHDARSLGMTVVVLSTRRDDHGSRDAKTVG